MKIAVKEWKLRQIKEDNQGKEFFTNLAEIERETEKAYLVNIEACWLDGEDTTIKCWVPKSATMSPEEAQAETETKASRYETLVAFCKANGIKGARKGMRAATMLDKIKAAGLVYEY